MEADAYSAAAPLALEIPELDSRCMASSSSGNEKQNGLIQRIQSARAALKNATDLDTRNALLNELDAATRELTALILEKEGRLKGPVE